MLDITAAVDSMNAEKLKGIFQINELAAKYIGYVPLMDRQAGFTVKREYSSNFKYKPPRTRDGKPDVVAIIRVKYMSPKETKKTIEGSVVPIFLLISPFSEYLNNHIDYDFDDEQCPPEESIRASESTMAPAKLVSFDEYVYDHESNTLQTTKGKVMLGEEVLDTVFKEHCNTIHLFRGLKFRLKRGLKDFSVGSCTFCIRILEWILKMVFGRTLRTSMSSRGLLTPYKREDLQLLKTESVTLFGYKASINVCVTWGFMMVIAFVMSRIFHLGILSDMFSNALVLVCVALITLWALDKLMPYVVLTVLNLLVVLRKTLMMTIIRT